MIEKFANQSFVYCPSTGQPRQIRLNKDKSVEDFQIKSFNLLTDQGQPSIIFSDEKGNFVSRLQWESKVFRGRDHVGPVELRPSDPSAISLALVPERVVRLHAEQVPPPGEKKINLQRSLNLPKFDGETALALIGFNRPAYMAEVVEALAPQVKEVPVYVFLDRPEEEGQLSVTLQQQEQISEKIPHAHFILREMNYGCGLNIIDAREQLFQLYDKVFVFEDDMVPSSNYLEFCQKLLEWAEENYSNVGAVQGWSRCLLSEAAKKKVNSEIHVTYDNCWGYLMTKDCWNSIRASFFDYVPFLDDRRYGARDNLRISRWQAKFKQLNFSPFGENPVPRDNLAIHHENEMLANLPTGQDGMTYLLMRTAGLVRLAPTVNRGKYIGKIGIHSTPDLYYKSQLDKVVLDEMSIPRKFKMRGSK